MWSRQGSMEVSRSFKIITVLTFFAFLFIPQITWGQECIGNNGEHIILRTQEDVDSFQSTYGDGGTCDTIKGSLHIVPDNGIGSDITDLGGLLDIKEISANLHITYNPKLTNIDGLASLTRVGYQLLVHANPALVNVDGLSSLAGSLSSLGISENPVLDNVNGLSYLNSVRGNLGISNNNALTNIDGISSIRSVGSSVSIRYNNSLANCAGMARLVDQWDDLSPGPGPGIDGVPDVGFAVQVHDNLDGCNSIQEIMAGVDISNITAGLNDAWFYPDTEGQGFFISVFEDLGVVSLAWFTYDTELPSPGAQANLGDPGHRWMTAVGPISGNQAIMQIEMTSGGIFDTATQIDRTNPPLGTIILTFNSCNTGTVVYYIPSIKDSGTVPIQRVADDNIALCEALITH